MISGKQLKAWLITPPEKTTEQVIGNGLAIRASKKGVISFYFRYKLNGRDKRATLGNYPVITIKMAKEEAMRLALVYQQGCSLVDAAKSSYRRAAIKATTTHAIARAVSRIRAKLKIAHFVPHDFRRTIATRLAEQGGLRMSQRKCWAINLVALWLYTTAMIG